MASLESRSRVAHLGSVNKDDYRMMSAARFLLAQASPVEHLRSSPSISN